MPDDGVVADRRPDLLRLQHLSGLADLAGTRGDAGRRGSGWVPSAQARRGVAAAAVRQMADPDTLGGAPSACAFEASHHLLQCRTTQAPSDLPTPPLRKQKPRARPPPARPDTQARPCPECGAAGTCAGSALRGGGKGAAHGCEGREGGCSGTVPTQTAQSYCPLARSLQPSPAHPSLPAGPTLRHDFYEQQRRRGGVGVIQEVRPQRHHVRRAGQLVLHRRPRLLRHDHLPAMCRLAGGGWAGGRERAVGRCKRLGKLGRDNAVDIPGRLHGARALCTPRCLAPPPQMTCCRCSHSSGCDTSTSASPVPNEPHPARSLRT